MPSAVAQSTVVSTPLAADSETVKRNCVVPVLPSRCATSSTESTGMASSLVIVPVATDVPSEPFVGEDSVTVKLSVFSYLVSPTTCTVMLPAVEPTGIVSVPLPAT